MRSQNKKFRIQDSNLKRLDFIMLDLYLNMQKQGLSEDDIELLKAL